jgi:hypothetical protein
MTRPHGWGNGWDNPPPAGAYRVHRDTVRRLVDTTQGVHFIEMFYELGAGAHLIFDVEDPKNPPYQTLDGLFERLREEPTRFTVIHVDFDVEEEPPDFPGRFPRRRLFTAEERDEIIPASQPT